MGLITQNSTVEWVQRSIDNSTKVLETISKNEFKSNDAQIIDFVLKDIKLKEYLEDELSIDKQKRDIRISYKLNDEEVSCLVENEKQIKELSFKPLMLKYEKELTELSLEEDLLYVINHSEVSSKIIDFDKVYIEGVEFDVFFTIKDDLSLHTISISSNRIKKIPVFLSQIVEKHNDLLCEVKTKTVSFDINFDDKFLFKGVTLKLFCEDDRYLELELDKNFKIEKLNTCMVVYPFLSSSYPNQK